MRFNLAFCLVMSLFTAIISLAEAPNEGTAELSGAVEGTNGPAFVYLVLQDAKPTSHYDGYQAAAEKDGRFSFAYVRPGTYRIRAEAAGFMSAPPQIEGMEITLRTGEKRTGVIVRMVRRQIVCGRVTENGVPRESPTWVWAYRYDKETGEISRTFLPATEPNGTYRFDNLGSGTYYLQGYTTWYPGSFNFNGAQPVTVEPAAGSSECPFNIALQYTGCHGVRVTGRIAGEPSGSGAQYHVNFLDRNTSGGSMPTVIGNNDSGLYRSGDPFSALVCPGDYDVVLSDKEGYGITGDFRAHKVTLDSQTVTVGSTEVDDLVLTPHPMASISGEVHFEGVTRNASCPGLGGQYVDILREGDAQFQSATLDDKNRFEIQNVAPGNYSVYLAPFLSEAVYLKSIAVDGKASEGRRVSIASAASTRFDITLSGDLAHAAGHLPPDLRRTHRWDVAWMRPKGSVSGKVLGDASTGYTLKLLSARYNSNASAEYMVKSGSDGSFRFDDVDPGVYTLRAEAENFLSVEFGAREAGMRGTPIVVERGAQIRDLTLAPPKLGSICGRVTDASGAVSSHTEILVEAFRNRQLADYYNFIYDEGRGPHVELSTDDDGRFRADRLVPGEYYIGFRWRNRIPYFSSDGSLSAEVPIQLRVGESPGCTPDKPLEFGIPAGLDQVHAISGQILGNIPKSEGDRFWINLLSETLSGQSYAGSAQVDDNRQFHLDGVPKGKYRLQLLSAYGPPPTAWSGPFGPVSHVLATQKIQVQDNDALGVVIKPERLPTVSGKVRFENLPAEWKENFNVTSQMIVLVPNDYRAPFSGKLAADGSFTIDAEDPGDYEVELAQPGSQLYIRSLILDGHTIAGRYLHLRTGQAANLEVVVGGDAGHVLAEVAPDMSLPKPEPPVEEPCDRGPWPIHQLVLFPESFPAQTGDSDLSAQPIVFFGYRTGDDVHPQIGVDALPPGIYRALAAENLQHGMSFAPWNEVPVEELRHWSELAKLGEPITVKAGQKLEIALPDKTVDVARLAAQWGLRLDAGVMNVP
jgi:hypothetical protein